MYDAARYSPIFVSKRMFVIQNSYAKAKDLESIKSAIAVFDRDGSIADVNNIMNCTATRSFVCWSARAFLCMPTIIL